MLQLKYLWTESLSEKPLLSRITRLKHAFLQNLAKKKKMRKKCLQFSEQPSKHMPITRHQIALIIDNII